MAEENLTAFLLINSPDVIWKCLSVVLTARIR